MSWQWCKRWALPVVLSSYIMDKNVKISEKGSAVGRTSRKKWAGVLGSSLSEWCGFQEAAFFGAFRPSHCEPSCKAIAVCPGWRYRRHVCALANQKDRGRIGYERGGDRDTYQLFRGASCLCTIMMSVYESCAVPWQLFPETFVLKMRLKIQFQYQQACALHPDGGKWLIARKSCCHLFRNL